VNLDPLANYFVNGKGPSVGSPNKATAFKLPQLNTGTIKPVTYNAGITYTATDLWSRVPHSTGFTLTDRDPSTGIPYVKINQAVGPHVSMTNLTFTKLPFIVSNTSAISFGTLKLLTMPFGRFAFHGGACIFTSIDWSNGLSFVQTTGVAGTAIGTGGSGDFSLGTTGTTDSTINSTDVDIVASTAFLDPFVAGVGSNIATPGNVLNGPTEFDGSTTTTSGTAKTINLNVIVDDADVVDTNAGLMYLTGFLRIYTSWLGDW
jgi:hypothetical protein